MKSPKIIPLIIACFFCFFISNAQDIAQMSYDEIINFTMTHYGRGEYELAAKYMKVGREKALKEFGKQDSIYSEYTSNLGLLYKELGMYKEAEVLYLESREIDAKVYGTNHKFYAISLNNLAVLYQTMNRYELAEPLMQEAKSIYAKTVGTQDPLYANVLTNLAVVYQHTNKLKKSESLLLEAKSIYAKLLENYSSEYAGILNNLAHLYQDQGQYKLALSLFLEVKEIDARDLGTQHPIYAGTLNSLASVYANLKQYENALKLYQESADIKAITIGEKHPEYINSLSKVATTYGQIGEEKLAWETIDKVMMICVNSLKNNEISVAWKDSVINAQYPSERHLEVTIAALNIMYQLLAVQMATDKQVIVCDAAIGLYKKLKNTYSDENDKMLAFQNVVNWAINSLILLDKNTQIHKAFQIMEESRSVLLLESFKSEKFYQIGELPDSLAKKEKAMLKLKSRLQGALAENRLNSEKESIRIKLNQINLDINSFKEKITKEYPKYAKLKFQNSTVSIENVQNLLNAETALIEYMFGDSGIYVFYIDKNSSKWVEVLVATQTWADKITELHNSLSDYNALAQNSTASYQKYTKTAYWFYENALAPVLKNTKGIKELIIVTDGMLGYLPFETFLVEQAPQKQVDYAKLHYLVNDYTVSYNYSATLFVEGKEKASRKNNAQILAMATNYEINDKQSKLPAHQSIRELLAPLPEARKEVEMLQSKCKGFFAFDAVASEKIFKEKAADYAIIHLAMHGLLDNKAPILSSLVFTATGDSLEDDFLQAYEISKMNLNAELIVLSACETGYGEFEKGNGIASLARAFMYAGASSLVVSLWQVNDLATSIMMKNLYENLGKGMNKATALRQAKLDYLKNAQGIAQHPAFWSPFILIGDNRPIEADFVTNDKNNMLFIGGGLLVIGLLGAFMWKKNKKI